MFWGKGSNEETKNIFGIYLRKFPKKKYILLDSTILLWKNPKIFKETILYHIKATEKYGLFHNTHNIAQIYRKKLNIIWTDAWTLTKIRKTLWKLGTTFGKSLNITHKSA